MSVQRAGAAGAVGDAAGLLVYGSEAWRWGRRALRVALHGRQQDAAQRGLSGWMEDQLRGEAWRKWMQTLLFLSKDAEVKNSLNA